MLIRNIVVFQEMDWQMLGMKITLQHPCNPMRIVKECANIRYSDIP